MDDLQVSIPSVSSHLLSTVHLTPPYSPGNLSLLGLKSSKDESLDTSLLLVSEDKMLCPKISTPCCKRHQNWSKRPTDSEGSLIHEDCVGSRTCNREVEIPVWALGMTGRELEIRLDMAEIQKLYKEQQKELNKLRRWSKKKQKFKLHKLKVIPELALPEEKQEEAKPKLEVPPLCNGHLASSAFQSEAAGTETANPKLDASMLSDRMRVMVLEGGLFYSGQLKVLDKDALIYTVQVDGQRSSRPYVLCQEELVKNALKETHVQSKDELHTGSRVCALWSGQLQAFYPGTVENTDCGYSKKDEALITIGFDDGDSGQISLSDIRHLPSDFPITKASTSVLPEFITRRRKSRDVGVALEFPEPKVANRRRSSSESGQSATVQLDWQWDSEATNDNKRKRDCYTRIRRGDNVVEVGDLVHLQHGTPQRGCAHPYVAVVESFWQSRNKAKRVRVAWCYRAHEVHAKMTLPPDDVPNALFRSSHYDDNSVQTIVGACSLLSLDQIRSQRSKDPKSVTNAYFIAGSYDPVSNELTWTLD